jgi:hypothetical protein
MTSTVRNKFFNRANLCEYKRSFTVIAPPMTWAEILWRIGAAIFLMISMRNIREALILGAIYITETIWDFLVIDAEFYALEKSSGKENGKFDRDFCTSRVIVSELNRKFTMVTPPFTWFDFLGKILKAAVGFVVIADILEGERENGLIKELLYLGLAGIAVWLIQFLFIFFFPKANYYLTHKNEIQQQ